MGLWRPGAAGAVAAPAGADRGRDRGRLPRAADRLAGGAAAARRGRAVRVQLCRAAVRSEEHTSELQSLMRISYAVFCLKKNTKKHTTHSDHNPTYTNITTMLTTNNTNTTHINT